MQRSGERVRITAQLIRASDGFHIWSESYDRRLKDIFAIQDVIAVRVGESLASTILEAEPEILVRSFSTDSVDAYNLYLQARAETVRFSFNGLGAAESLLKRALGKDPDFLDAKAALALNLMQKAINSMRPMEEVLDELPNNSEIRLIFGSSLRSMNAAAEAIPHLQAATRLDPLNSLTHLRLGTTYTDVREWNAAKSAILEAICLEPGSPNAFFVLGDVEAVSGNGLAMISNYIQTMKVDPADYGYAMVVAENLYYIGLPEVELAYQCAWFQGRDGQGDRGLAAPYPGFASCDESDVALHKSPAASRAHHGGFAPAGCFGAMARGRSGIPGAGSCVSR